MRVWGSGFRILSFGFRVYAPDATRAAAIDADEGRGAGGERPPPPCGARAVGAWLSVSLADECERASSRPEPGRGTTGVGGTSERVSSRPEPGREGRLSIGLLPPGGEALWSGGAGLVAVVVVGGRGVAAPFQSCMISVAARSMRDQHRSCYQKRGSSVSTTYWSESTESPR